MSTTADPANPSRDGPSTNGRILLPAAPTEQRTADADRHPVLDGLLLGLVALLAALLGSAPASNSSIWTHLAAGRMGFSGTEQFEREPFASTTEGVRWVNQNWLIDMVAYSVYRAGGGTGLAVAVIALAVALAVVLVRVGRSGAGGWMAAVAAAITLLVVGPDLAPAPVLVSMLFLGVLLWLLERRRRTAPDATFAPAVALALIVLWADCDGWYVLGPFALILYGFGRLLDGELRKSQAGMLLAIGAGLAAGLFTPYLWHGWRLPPELTVSVPDAARADPVFAAPLLRPFSAAYRASAVGQSVAGWAFYALLALSGLSFLLNLRGWSWRLALLWSGFAALAAYRASAIPFFAVVAGPVLALNAQVWASRLKPSATGVGWAFAGRFVTAAVLIGLAVAAWPGWLQPKPYQPRTWAVEPDPSLERAAKVLAGWWATGAVPDDRIGFNLSPDAAHHAAFFGPAEKGFVDARPGVFPADAAVDYAAIRFALAEDQSGIDWRAILRARKVDHVIVYDRDRSRMTRVLRRLGGSPEEWPLLYADGGVSVFGWADPQRPGSAEAFTARRLDVPRMAYLPPDPKTAPPDGPAEEPQPATWKTPFVLSQAAPSADREEAAMHLLMFEAARPRFADRNLRVWRATQSAALAPLAPLGAGPAPAALDWTARVRLSGPVGDAVAFRLGEGDPDHLFLAIRAARRAIRADPADARAYHILGEAYLRLYRDTRERVWANECLPLDTLRKAQILGALRQAVALKPDLLAAQTTLADVLVGMQQFDMAVEHAEQALALTEKAGPGPDESGDAYADRLGQARQRVEDLRKVLTRQQDLYVTNARNLKVTDQALQAVGRGLPATALAVLRESDVSAFGRTGLELELELLLLTGQPRKVLDWTSKDHQEILGDFAYGWVRFRAAAALGDYRRADEEMAEVLRRIGAADSSARDEARVLAAQALARPVLEGAVMDGFPSRGFVQELLRQQMTMQLRSTTQLLQQRSTLIGIRALLALERGDADAARAGFTVALTQCQGQGKQSPTALAFQAEGMCEEYLKALTEDR